jgi:hypothetical protein
MKNQHRLRVSRTTIRTLDVAEMTVGGGTLPPPTVTCGCPPGETGPTNPNGSAGRLCPPGNTELVSL